MRLRNKYSFNATWPVRSPLAQHLEKLAAKGVNLSSTDATAVKGGKKVAVVYTVEAPAKASEPTATAPAT